MTLHGRMNAPVSDTLNRGHIGPDTSHGFMNFDPVERQ